MDEGRLLAVLQEAIAHSKVETPAGVVHPLIQYMKSHIPKIEPGAESKLLEVIRSEGELQIFDNRMQRFLSTASRVTHELLVQWLVARGREVGAARTVEDIKRYLAEQEIPIVEVAVLAGIEVPETVDLGGGIRLVPFSEVPESLAKISLTQNPYDFLMRRRHSAALLCTSLSPKYHAEGDNPEIPYVEGRRRDLHEACMILTLAGPSAPIIVASWTTPEAWVPCGPGGGWSSLGLQFGAPTTTLIPAEKFAYVREVHELYTLLSQEVKQTLRIPIERLNQAIRRLNTADAAIDLGISMESLFFSDRDPDRGELGFTLRVRVARYLGASEEERKELARLVRRIYAARSAAVHSGSVPSEVEGTEVKKLLENGYQMMAKAIDKLIRAGQVPDWTSVVFA